MFLSLPFSYLKNKQSSTPSTLTAPAPLVAQQLAPKQIKSYATASLPASQKTIQQQQQQQQTASAKRYDFFENENLDDIIKPSRMPPWNPDPFVKNSPSPQPQPQQPTQNSNFVDGNFNQIAQQNSINKVVNGGQSEPSTLFPFSRPSTQKSGNVYNYYFYYIFFIL